MLCALTVIFAGYGMNAYMIRCVCYRIASCINGSTRP